MFREWYSRRHLFVRILLLLVGGACALALIPVAVALAVCLVVFAGIVGYGVCLPIALGAMWAAKLDAKWTGRDLAPWACKLRKFLREELYIYE